MPRRFGYSWPTLLLVCLLAGCGGDLRPGYPQVPLLVSKKPVEMKSESTVAALAPQEPTLPPPPQSALVSIPPDFEKYVRLVKRSQPPKPDTMHGPTVPTVPQDGPRIPSLDKSDASMPEQRLPEPLPAKLPPVR
jgi:hypothetical protein